MLFVVVDAHSKWPEVFTMSATTTEMITEVLRKIFARHMQPIQLVCDNGPQFMSNEFEAFVRNHPASSGLAERFVQSDENK